MLSKCLLGQVVVMDSGDKGLVLRAGVYCWSLLPPAGRLTCRRVHVTHTVASTYRETSPAYAQMQSKS